MAGFVAAASPQVRREGKYSASLSGSPGLLFQDVTGLTPNTFYAISAWLPSSSTGGSGKLTAHNTRDGNYVESASVTPIDEWRKLTVLFKTDQLGAARISLVRNGSAAGALFWDDVSIAEAPLNGGFETGGYFPWLSYAPQPGFVVELPADRPDGKGKFSLAQSGNGGLVFQDIAGLIPGRDYAVSAWVRASSLGSSASAKLTAHNTKDGGLVQSRSVVPTEAWQQLKLTFRADVTGSIRISLVRNPGGYGTLLWDDVAIE
jgi:hypothetical protein